MISCTDAVRRLWDYLEEELERHDREEVEQHLALCRSCCGEVEFAQELRAFMRHRPPAHLPPALERRFDAFLTDLEGSGAP